MNDKPMSTSVWQKYVLFCALIAMMFSVNCAPQSIKSEDSQAIKKDRKIYTAFNMWYEKPYHMSCVNYKKGTLISVGTEVSYVTIKDQSESDFGPYIEFWSGKYKELFRVIWQPQYYPKKTIQDYANLMFTNKPFDMLTQEFNAKELEAIKNGFIVEGMNKKAVLVSVGIPPGHYTASLDANSWFYWMSRLKKIEICFDSNEKSIDCKKIKPNYLLK